MMKRSGLTLAILALSIVATMPTQVASAQTLEDNVPGLIWATWGGNRNDTGNAVTADSSGNIYIAGSTQSFGAGKTSALVLKYDANGNLTWARTWGENKSRSDYGEGVGVDSSGNIYTAGVSEGSANLSAVFLLKFNPAGSLVWQKTFSINNITNIADMVVDSSGAAYLTGETGGSNATSEKLVLLKVDTLGTISWLHSLRDNATSSGEGLALDSSGSVYVTGFRQSLGAKRSAILFKFDKVGSLLWQRAWNGTAGEEGVKLTVDSSGYIDLTGNTSSYGAGGVDIMLLKFNSTGTAIWQGTWGGSGRDEAGGIGVDEAGNIFVSGLTTNQTSLCDLSNAYLLKINASDLPSSIVMGYGFRGYAYCSTKFVVGQTLGLAIDGSGNAITTGFTDTPSPIFFSGNKTLGEAHFSIVAVNVTSYIPTIQTGVANGIVSKPIGSQDALYGFGNEKVLLFKDFMNPPTYYVGVGYSCPPHCTLESYEVGTYIAVSPILLCDCSQVSGWNSSGGVTIVNESQSFSSFEYIVYTVTGPGILQFPEWEPNYYPSQQHPTIAPGPFLLLILLIVPAGFLLRKRQTSKARLTQ
jgi:beta-propeller repeat-containing protein